MRPDAAGSVLLAACSRQELLQQLKSIVYNVAPLWGDEYSATIEITSPKLGRADVQAAFDEIDEKCHLQGITLRIYDRQHDECARVVLEASWR